MRGIVRKILCMNLMVAVLLIAMFSSTNVAKAFTITVKVDGGVGVVSDVSTVNSGNATVVFAYPATGYDLKSVVQKDLATNASTTLYSSAVSNSNPNVIEFNKVSANYEITVVFQISTSRKNAITNAAYNWINLNL